MAGCDFPLRKFPTAHLTAELDQLADMPDFTRLDTAVKNALSYGWPQWETPGTGGGLPRTKGLVDFDYTNFKDCARVDFFRGTDKDDKPNDVWNRLYHQLPSYQRYWCEGQLHRPVSPNTVGNSMEALVGVSYAAASASAYLPDATQLHWDSDAQVREWACSKSSVSRRDCAARPQTLSRTQTLSRRFRHRLRQGRRRRREPKTQPLARAASPEGSETPLADFGSDHGSDTEPGTSPEPQRRGQRSQGALPATPEALSAPKPAAPLPAPPTAPQTLHAPSVQVLAAELEAGEQREQILDTTKFRKRRKK